MAYLIKNEELTKKEKKEWNKFIEKMLKKEALFGNIEKY